MNLSFCGSGFLGIYHLGVATCLKKHGPTLLSKVDKIAGASAGALIAAALVIDDSKLQEYTDFNYKLADEVRSKPLGALTPGYNLLDSLRQFIDLHMPEDGHKIASGKLYISLTNVKTKKNELVHQYKSREHVIQCLIATSHIPYYASRHPVEVDGKQYIDGGITDNMVIFKEGRTIQVSPFCGREDISPQDKDGRQLYLNINSMDIQLNRNNMIRLGHALLPPPSEILTEYYKQGYDDAKQFLIREKLLTINEEIKVFNSGIETDA